MFERDPHFPLSLLHANTAFIERPLEYLDELSLSDRATANQLRVGLLALQPTVLVESYGTDAGLWAVLTEPEQRYHPILDLLEDEFGYDLHALDVARIWKLQQAKPEQKESAKSIVKLYFLRRSLQESLDTILLPKLMRSSTLPGIEPSEQRANNYSLQAVHIDNQSQDTIGGGVTKVYAADKKDIFYDVWLDTTVGFILEHKGLPNAIVGLDYNSASELIIRQLQGIRGKRLDPSKPRAERVIGRTSARGLMTLDWRKCMVDVTQYVADGLDLASIAIQAGKNNYWTTALPNESKPHLTMEQARTAYDKPAQRLGFTKLTDDSEANWHRQVPQLRSFKRDR